MARFFVFIVVFGGLVLSMCATKPTEADYLSKLEGRAAIVASSDHDAFSQLRGGDPVDETLGLRTARRVAVPVTGPESSTTYATDGVVVDCLSELGCLGAKATSR